MDAMPVRMSQSLSGWAEQIVQQPRSDGLPATVAVARLCGLGDTQEGSSMIGQSRFRIISAILLTLKAEF